MSLCLLHNQFIFFQQLLRNNKLRFVRQWRDEFNALHDTGWQCMADWLFKPALVN